MTYNNCAATARVYKDRTVAVIPHIKWVDGKGIIDGVNEYTITGQAHALVKELFSDGAEDSAWTVIYDNI